MPGAEGLAEAGRRNSFEVMADAKLGQGAKFFRAEHLRDDHGRLLPAPGIVLAPATQQQATKLQQLLSSKGGATVTVRGLGDTGRCQLLGGMSIALLPCWLAWVASHGPDQPGVC